MSAVQQLLLGESAKSLVFRSAGTTATGTGTITPGLPSGTVQNDILVYVIATSSLTSGPSGYTATNASTNQLFIYYKIAGSSESATSCVTANADSIAQVFSYYNENTSTPIDVQMGATSATLTTTSITTTASNDFIISIFQTAKGSPTAWTAPGGTNTRANTTNTGALRGLLVVDELQVAAGASATRTATGPGSGSNFALALKL
jgi:hypothetical protein